MTTVRALFRSRKFLVALFGALQAIVLHYFAVDPEVWGAIAALAAVLIASIAYEDGAEKGAAHIEQRQVVTDDAIHDPH